MNKPLVSVIIPYHNEGELVNRAIASVCNQSFGGLLEVVVVDDGSTIPPPLKRDYRIPVHLVHTGGNIYVGGARNLGARQSLGDVLCFLDADDTYNENRIDAHVQFLDSHPYVVFVGGLTLVHRETPFVKGSEFV